MGMRVGIIGAGIAGLTLGTRLAGAGHSVALFDKGRGAGGRASTRRREGLAFDHGAQYFTVRDPEFRAFLDDHVPGDHWAEWAGRFAVLEGGRLLPEESSEPRFVGVPGMSALAGALAKGLETHAETRVVGLVGSPGRWRLVDSNGLEHGPFGWVVATAPPAQSAALLSGYSPIAEEASRVVMRPCFALMIVPEGETSLPADGIRCHHPVLGWAANDHGKPGRGPTRSIVIHSNHDWGQAHVDDDLSTVARALRAASSEAFGVDLDRLAFESVHRWLYARPVEPLGRPCLLDHSAGLAICGDWLLAAKIEGAFRSGNACAQALLGGSAG